MGLMGEGLGGTFRAVDCIVLSDLNKVGKFRKVEIKSLIVVILGFDREVTAESTSDNPDA
ncbi:hypothetical protein AM10699_04460 [Acaryochloris marina MBIC10699]|nr:hypothetical protein AM10699_04460 [Acaryochloris marina MBIC10699]